MEQSYAGQRLASTEGGSGRLDCPSASRRSAVPASESTPRLACDRPPEAHLVLPRTNRKRPASCAYRLSVLCVPAGIAREGSSGALCVAEGGSSTRRKR